MRKSIGERGKKRNAENAFDSRIPCRCHDDDGAAGRASPIGHVAMDKIYDEDSTCAAGSCKFVVQAHDSPPKQERPA